MKYLAAVIFIFIASLANGQSFKSLNRVARRDTIPTGQAIIYGNFIQRLGFSSGGFPQDIRLVNLVTKKILIFRVKPTFKSAKENTFIYFIEPGKYAILNYWWTQSKWYGGKIFTELVLKDSHITNNLEENIESGRIQEHELAQFSFEIAENSLNYLGTWHFEKELVSFTDAKIRLDNLLKNKYHRLDFSVAKTELPR